MKEIIATAKTVELAIEKACKELGVTENQVETKVLEMPVKKFLGSTPAKVQVTLKEENKSEKTVAKVAATNKNAKQSPVKAKETPTLVNVQNLEGKDKAAVDFLADIVEIMGVEVETAAAEIKDEITVIHLDGKNIGSLIGRRGETMEALSFLTGLVANSEDADNHRKFAIDVAGYRGKRESDIVELAAKIGSKVKETGRSHVFEPMNPYERRLVHATIDEIGGLKSQSSGEGAHRKVIVRSTAANAVESEYGTNAPIKRGSFSGKMNTNVKRDPSKPVEFKSRNKSYEPRPERKPFKPTGAPVAAPRTTTVDDKKDTPLYGKIEF